MAFELKRDESIHCVETMTGRELTGTVELGTKSLHATIYSYGETFFLPREGPIYLRTAKNQHVSLYDNIVGGTGNTYTRGPPPLVTYQASVGSNRAVVGRSFWRPEDRVRRVMFRVPHADQLLRNGDYLATLASRDEHGAMIEVVSNGKALRVWYSATYGTDFDAPTSHWPTVELEFASGIPLGDVMAHVYDVIELFALSLWTPLRPDEIRICALSTAEMRAALESQTYPGDHTVEMVWDDKEVDRSRSWVGASPLACYDDEALQNTQLCLSAWLDRRDAWRNANAMMTQVLAKQGEVTADRLIAACRWLEEIPQARIPPALSDDDLAAIVGAATDAARTRGHTTMAPRIQGALRVLRRETHEERFTRLLASVADTFGLDRFPTEALPYLISAQRLRGTAAHGHFGQQTEQEFRDCFNAILATEALCMLLTAQALPLDAQAYDRCRSHPALEAFLIAYK